MSSPSHGRPRREASWVTQRGAANTRQRCHGNKQDKQPLGSSLWPSKAPRQALLKDSLRFTQAPPTWTLDQVPRSLLSACGGDWTGWHQNPSWAWLFRQTWEEACVPAAPGPQRQPACDLSGQKAQCRGKNHQTLMNQPLLYSAPRIIIC